MNQVQFLRCPHCHAPFSANERTLVCAEGHSFDRSRDGYVNLLGSKRVGDSLEMLRARRVFLEAGHYQPLAETLGEVLAELATELLSTREMISVMDAGCGEGYYLRQAAGALQLSVPADRITFLALDVSRDAVRLTARRCRFATCVVADLQEELPLIDRSLHLILNIFAPRRVPEFARVLAPGGTLIIAIPAPEHLVELRQELNLLGIEEQKEERLLASLPGKFSLHSRTPVHHDLHLDAVTLHNLLHMTPNHLHPERLLGSEKLIGRTVTASFVILACRRAED